MLAIGNKRQLSEEDLWELSDTEKGRTVNEALEREWNLEKDTREKYVTIFLEWILFLYARWAP